MDFICFKIPYEYRPCLDLKLNKITPRTRPQIRLYGVKNTACTSLKSFKDWLNERIPTPTQTTSQRLRIRFGSKHQVSLIKIQCFFRKVDGKLQWRGRIRSSSQSITN